MRLRARPTVRDGRARARPAAALCALVLMLAAAVSLPMTWAPTVWAQGARDGAYADLLRQSDALAAIEPTDAERRQLMRATAVTLAERLKRFVIAETETRAEDKIIAPPAASLRPGEGAPEATRAPSDERAAIDAVPDPWFARYAIQARSDLSTLIDALDSGSAGAADLMLQADTVNLLLRDMARPPEG